MLRRNLSGIFIFDKFDDEDKLKPTCFEDCNEKTQDDWLDTLDEQGVKRFAKLLGSIIKEIGEQFDLVKQ